MLLSVCTVLLAAAAPVAPAEKPLRAMPTLGREPKLDGVLKDLAGAQDFKMPPTATAPTASLQVKGAFRKDTVWLGVRVNDARPNPADELTLTLFFPGAGVTARGYAFKFGSEGARPPAAEAVVPAYALEAVKAATKADAKGFTLEVGFPVRALPRFQARTQLVLSICVEYADGDAAGASPLQTCSGGEMAGGPTRVPDELRRVVKVAPPAEVEGLEPRANGFVGFAELQYPTWGYTDTAMSAEELRVLIAGRDSIDPHQAKLPISDNMVLPDGRPVYTVVTGKDPYSGDNCDADQEVRLAMYGAKGNVASRVLEWPAITCGLGRAVSISLSPEGHLQIGYSNGSVANFAFTTDRFERSELGVK